MRQSTFAECKGFANAPLKISTIDFDAFGVDEANVDFGFAVIETDTKKAVLAAFNSEPDIAKRGPLWGKVQALVYEEVPFVEVGRFNGLSARSAKLQGYEPAVWPFFWNTSLAK